MLPGVCVNIYRCYLAHSVCTAAGEGRCWRPAAVIVDNVQCSLAMCMFIRVEAFREKLFVFPGRRRSINVRACKAPEGGCRQKAGVLPASHAKRSVMEEKMKDLTHRQNGCVRPAILFLFPVAVLLRRRVCFRGTGSELYSVHDNMICFWPSFQMLKNNYQQLSLPWGGDPVSWAGISQG